MRNYHTTKRNHGFTLIELIVTMVIIGILSGISIVGYGSWKKSTVTAQLKSDLSGVATAMENYRNFNNTYPASVPTTFKASNGVVLAGGSTDGKNYCVKATNPSDASLSFHIDSYSTGNEAKAGDCRVGGPDWIVIGAQTWAKANLNVGMMVTGATTQTNNSTLEKYCYNDTESNCTTYGALYQWDEAMQYVTTEGAQGICPAGSHVPSDNDWKVLEVSLGMTQAQADVPYDYRGTDQGTKLKTGGSSGLNVPFAGYRLVSGSFYNLSSFASLWSSSESSTIAWGRFLEPSPANVFRGTDPKALGFSVRCVGD